MLDSLFEEAYTIAKEYNSESAALLMRKLKIDGKRAASLIGLIRMEKWKEIRKLAKEIEDKL